jgi:hypothetical protein
LRTAVFALRQHSARIFASTKPAPTGSSLDSGNGCVAENNFRRFIGHAWSVYEAAWDAAMLYH